MDETLGQKLRKARTARELSVEDAARATKISAGRLLDIENDSYDNFTHITYAKNFVVLYARYLRVDFAPYAEDFDTGNVINVDDYQYLKGTAPVAEIRRATNRRGERPLVTVAAITLIGVAGFCAWTVANVGRLGDLDSFVSRTQAGGPPVPVEEVTAGSQPEVNRPGAPVAQSPDELLSTESAPATPTPAEETGLTSPITPGVDLLASLQAPGPTAPLPPRAMTADEAAAVEGSQEVVLRPLKETWVTVTLNDSNAAPVFDNVVRPGDTALHFKGERFWVFVNDANSVEIHKNSESVPQTTTSLYLQ